MDLLSLGAKMFTKSLGGGSKGMDPGVLQSALGGLIGDGDQLNLGSLVSNMQKGGLGSLLGSWLGDGANQAVSSQQLGNILGDDKIRQFASRLDIDENLARNGLSQALPEVVDKSSSGGSLLDAVGGVGGLMGMVNKIIK